jgi:hypothetical protein
VLVKKNIETQRTRVGGGYRAEAEEIDRLLLLVSYDEPPPPPPPRSDDRYGGGSIVSTDGHGGIIIGNANTTLVSRCASNWTLCNYTKREHPTTIEGGLGFSAPYYSFLQSVGSGCMLLACWVYGAYHLRNISMAIEIWID